MGKPWSVLWGDWKGKKQTPSRRMPRCVSSEATNKLYYIVSTLKTALKGEKTNIRGIKKF